MSRLATFLLIGIVWFLSAATHTFAAPPANFQSTLIVGSGLTGPSGFEFSPDGRIFILQRTGEILIYKNGALLPQPFAILPSVATGDRGLIGIAFDPDFQTNHYVYFYYTGVDLLNRLVRYNASADTGTDGPVILYQTTFPSQELHVGGSIRFGPDGKLYFAVGDNGYPPNAQDISNPHGKILRINKDGTIPSDNPFVGQSGALPEIWAYGFRNPWRFQFDSLTGQLYGGDVGDFTTEEVNHIQKGNNYGWPLAEGSCTACVFTNPIYSYPHNNLSSAVTGGPVYRGSMFPSDYYGSLFFGDYARGFIKRLTLDANGNSTGVFDFDTQSGSVVDMKVASDGSLYYITYIPGRLYRINYSLGNHIPVVSASSDVTKGTNPLTVHFTSAGTFDPDGDPLTYTWDFGDGSTSTAVNPVKTYSTTGTYTVLLHVSDSTNTALAVPIIIQVGIAPNVQVSSPIDGSTYKAGDTIFYTASGTDGAGFDLSDGAFTTEVVFHHSTHIHPFLGPITSKTGTFTIPTTGESSADTWFEVKITATDTNGLSTSKSVFIYPQKVTVSLNTTPVSLPVSLDGVPQTVPLSFQAVVGFRRELDAPSLASTNGTTYQFDSWSDSGAQKHILTIPATNTTVTAAYSVTTGFTGQYFPNKTLSGSPVLTRNDGVIDFNWGLGSPDALIPTENFSVRWTKQHTFISGSYTFTAGADDGFRVLIDGVPLIDKWIDQSFTSYSVTTQLTGTHTVTMEYYESFGNAQAKLSWEKLAVVPTSTPTPTMTPTPTIALSSAYTAQYFANQTLSGVPVVTRTDPTIQFDWGDSSAEPTLPVDHFSARWTRTDSFTAGSYQVHVIADDGIRVFVDGAAVIDKWIDQPATSYATSIPLTEGVHTIVIEYYENAGKAVAQFDITSTSIPTSTPPPTSTPIPTTTPTPTPIPSVGYQASYWSVPAAGSAPPVPTVPPTFTRTDADIQFNWASGSPDVAIPVDHFIAQWRKKQTFESATYLFTTESDDGIRLYIDNELIINQWNDHGDTVISAVKSMTAGDHDIRVEYYENAGDAVAKFSFTKSSDTGFAAQYFDNQTLTGSSIINRNEPAVQFNWQGGSPDSQLPVDHFSARWTKDQVFSGSPVTFTLHSDDGIRLWVDSQLLVDDWTDHAEKTDTVTTTIAQGIHTIKIEYYENSGNAIATFQQN